MKQVATRELPRVVVEGVTPQIDGGRYAIKRCEGDTVRVEADIFKDGHDFIAARVLFRGPGEETFRTARLTYEFNEDRWHGEFPVTKVGLWQYTIEAWPDHYRTWRTDLTKRLDAGQD